MKILLAAATAMETRQIREQHSTNTGKQYANLEIDFLETRVGMLSSAVSLCAAVSRYKYDLIVQAGIAGCFDSSAHLGTVYQVSEEIIGDLGVEENGIWKDVFDLHLEEHNKGPFKNGEIPGYSLKEQWRPLLASARGITVNQITSLSERKQQLSSRYDALLESMEGAALHYVGQTFDIPFIQLRSTSNYVGERNKAAWRMKEAVLNLNDALSMYLKQLNNTL